MACVQPYAVNPNNFLRWHPAADTTIPFAVPLAYCDTVLRICAPVLDPSVGEEFATLPVVESDQISFIINSLDGIDVTRGMQTLRLGLVQNGKLITPKAGDLNAIPDPNNATAYFIYGTLSILCEPDGIYWPVIYDKDDLHVLLIANPIEVVNWQHWDRDTVVVKFRHPANLHGFQYKKIPGVYQQFRLSLSMHKPVINTSEDTYTDRNNYTRRTKLDITQTYALETDVWDLETYRAAALMLTHKEVYIDGKLVLGSLDPDYIDGGRGVGWLVAKGKVLDLNFSRQVLAC